MLDLTFDQVSCAVMQMRDRPSVLNYEAISYLIENEGYNREAVFLRADSLKEERIDRVLASGWPV